MNKKWVLVDKSSYHYIYLLQTHHCIDMKENVYKLGKTTQQNIKRIRNYPKCTKLLLHMECRDCHESEKILLEKFRNEFAQEKKYGDEFFRGDCEEMKKIIIRHIISPKFKFREMTLLEKIRSWFS